MTTIQDIMQQGQIAQKEGANPNDVAAWIKAWQAAPEYTHNNDFATMFGDRRDALAGTFGQQGRTGEDGVLHDIAVDPAAAAQAYKLKYGIDASQALDPNAWMGKAYASNLLGLKSGSSAGYNGGDANDAITYAQLKRIDPNATIDAHGNYQFDESKLPQFMGGKVNTDASKYGGWVNAPIHTGDPGHVLNKNAVYKDPIYGDVTYRQNTFDPSADGNGGFMGQLGKYMPTIIGAIMSMGSGGMMSPGLISGLSSGNPLQALLGELAGMTGVPGASSLTNFIMQQMQKQKDDGHG